MRAKRPVRGCRGTRTCIQRGMCKVVVACVRLCREQIAHALVYSSCTGTGRMSLHDAHGPAWGARACMTRMSMYGAHALARGT
eukprot:364161-Chlamydomonas_euryale.AAC.5